MVRRKGVLATATLRILRRRREDSGSFLLGGLLQSQLLESGPALPKMSITLSC